MEARWDATGDEAKGLVRLAFASSVSARTSDLRCLFRCLALGAAVLARRCHARTNRVCTFLCFLRVHYSSPDFGSNADDPGPNVSDQEEVFLYRKEHVAILVASSLRMALPEFRDSAKPREVDARRRYPWCCAASAAIRSGWICCSSNWKELTGGGGCRFQLEVSSRGPPRRFLERQPS
jgi:hypothetical protein